jgi:hypothetical protein
LPLELRFSAGITQATQLWAELAEGLPKGLPQAGDQGLDFTPTWGRIYWGGALFCLLAELDIRRQSDNRVGLQHAMQGLLASGANYAQAWPVERVLQTADDAIGQRSLMTLYGRMKEHAMPVDLAPIWRDLGVRIASVSGVQLKEDAPLSAIRRAIESG